MNLHTNLGWIRLVGEGDEGSGEKKAGDRGSELRRTEREVGPGGSVALELPVEAIEAIAARAAEIVRGAERASAVEPWIGVREAAEHLHCRPQRIYSLVHQGRLEPHRDGARLLFRRSELDAWLTGNGSPHQPLARSDDIRDAL